MSLHTACDERFISRSYHSTQLNQSPGNHFNHAMISTQHASWNSDLPRQNGWAQNVASFHSSDSSSSLHIACTSEWADMAAGGSSSVVLQTDSEGVMQEGNESAGGLAPPRVSYSSSITAHTNTFVSPRLSRRLPDSRQTCEPSSFTRNPLPEPDTQNPAERLLPSSSSQSSSPVYSSPLTELSPSPLLPDMLSKVKEEPDSPVASPTTFIMEPLSPLAYKRSFSQSTSSGRSSPFTLRADPANRLLESQSLAPPTEVPLRTQAGSEMKECMHVIRLNPFSLHTGDAKGRRSSGNKDEKSTPLTWCGEEAKPLEEEPMIFEWQLDGYPHDLDSVELMVLNEVNEGSVIAAEQYVKVEENKNSWRKTPSSSLYTVEAMRSSGVSDPDDSDSHDGSLGCGMLEPETNRRRGISVDVEAVRLGTGYHLDDVQSDPRNMAEHSRCRAADFVSPHSQTSKTVPRFDDHYGNALGNIPPSPHHYESSSNVGPERSIRRSSTRSYEGNGHLYNTYTIPSHGDHPYHDDSSNTAIARRVRLKSPEELREVELEYPPSISMHRDSSGRCPPTYTETVNDHSTTYYLPSNDTITNPYPHMPPHPHLNPPRPHPHWAQATVTHPESSVGTPQPRPYRSISAMSDTHTPNRYISSSSSSLSQASSHLTSHNSNSPNLTRPPLQPPIPPGTRLIRIAPASSPHSSSSFHSHSHSLSPAASVSHSMGSGSGSPPVLSPAPRSLGQVSSSCHYSQIEDSSSGFIVPGTSGHGDHCYVDGHPSVAVAQDGLRAPYSGPGRAGVLGGDRLGYDCRADSVSAGQGPTVNHERRTRLLSPSPVPGSYPSSSSSRLPLSGAANNSDGNALGLYHSHSQAGYVQRG